MEIVLVTLFLTSNSYLHAGNIAQLQQNHQIRNCKPEKMFQFDADVDVVVDVKSQAISLFRIKLFYRGIF